MTGDQQEMQRLIEQGRQAAAGVISGGEMVLDVDPENGYFRCKLRNIQPAEATPQLVAGLCWVLSSGGAMFNLTVKQHTRQPGEAGGR